MPGRASSKAWAAQRGHTEAEAAWSLAWRRSLSAPVLSVRCEDLTGDGVRELIVVTTRGVQVLQLQLDNTIRENNNQQLIAFANVMVAKTVCRWACMPYRVAGHTHTGLFLIRHRGDGAKHTLTHARTQTHTH